MGKTQLVILLLMVFVMIPIASAIEYKTNEVIVIAGHDPTFLEDCNFTAWYPNMSEWQNGTMSGMNTVQFNNSFTTNVTGAYTYEIDCNGTDYEVGQFHVVQDSMALGGVAIGIGILMVALAIISVSIEIPFMDGFFLVIAELIGLIGLRTFHSMSGLTEYLAGYRIMLPVIVFTVIILFVIYFVKMFEQFGVWKTNRR